MLTPALAALRRRLGLCHSFIKLRTKEVVSKFREEIVRAWLDLNYIKYVVVFRESNVGRVWDTLSSSAESVERSLSGSFGVVVD